MMLQIKQDNLKYEVQFPNLPLAVYREIVAHLRQVEGVETGLYQTQSEHFDYNQSQVGGLWIQYTQIAGSERERVDQILAYYQNRYNLGEKANSQAENDSP